MRSVNAQEIQNITTNSGAEIPTSDEIFIDLVKRMVSQDNFDDFIFSVIPEIFQGEIGKLFCFSKVTASLCSYWMVETKN